jgi:RNA polymerase sigma-70 factor (ECF subfamily)
VAIYVDDKELIEAHRAGNSDAFEELAREYRSTLFRHAYKRLSCEASADDAVQETLVRAYKALPNFSGEYRLGPWLHRIMQNVCVDEIKRRIRDADKSERTAAFLKTEASSPSVEENLHLDFDYDELQGALKDLSGPYREALVMRFVEEMNYDEVALATGLSEQNVRARVSRAKSAMRLALKGVAAVPLLLVGLLKRGEKVAAAASSAGATSTIAGVSSSSAQLASASIPSALEVTHLAAQAAPAAVPVITKAAVGIGLAAAVFSPAADSTVHQAVQEVIASSETVVEVEQEAPEISAPVELSESKDLKPNASDDSFIGQLGSTIAAKPLAPLDVEETATASKLVISNELSFQPAGPGRLSLSGSAELLLSGVSEIVEIDSSSRVSLASEPDASDRYRIEGLLVLRNTALEIAEVRLIGFTYDSDDTMVIAGLYRTETGLDYFGDKGTFNGELTISDNVENGSLSLNMIQ